jgi:subtilase family serine protease
MSGFNHFEGHHMNMRMLGAVILTIPMAFGASRLLAQGGPGQSGVHVPDSSIEQPGERGQKAHTNHVISLRRDGAANGLGPGGGMSPEQIRSAYGVPVAGGAGTIAIVDAFDYPTAVNDFNVFSHQFGLPEETGAGSVFQVVYAKGRPRSNCGWAQESALDIQWAHAMAPNAKIVLVLAKSNSFTDLFQAVNVAESLPNVAQISMSWGGGEFSTEASYDGTFNADLTYFAASGDTGGVTIYPGVSPKVVSAGGTTLNMNNTSFVSETGWSGSGGGQSKYEPRPPFQNVISSIVGTKRGVPDFSFDANPQTGVSVYDSIRCQGLVGWMVFGGTSVSSPSLAGIVNNAQNGWGDAELANVYAGYGSAYSLNFRDISAGSAGGNTAVANWDFVTGIGSSLGTAGK